MMIQTLVDRLRTEGDGPKYRAATIRGWYRGIRAVLNYGVKLGILQTSPCRGIDMPEEQAHEAVLCTGEELGQLLDALRRQGHELYWPVSFAARNALRRGEAIAVRWQDIDFETGTITVRANLTTTGTKNFLKSAKTKSGETTAALIPEFLEELRELQKQRLAIGLMRCSPKEVSGVTPWDKLDPALTRSNQVFSPQGVLTRLRTFQRADGLLISGLICGIHTGRPLQRRESALQPSQNRCGIPPPVLHLISISMEPADSKNALLQPWPTSSNFRSQAYDVCNMAPFGTTLRFWCRKSCCME